MKIAYIGYDRSCLKAAKILSELGCSVIYFLTRPEQDLNFAPFDTAFIFSDQLMIPPLRERRTTAQQLEFASIEKNYKILQQNMCTAAGGFTVEKMSEITTEITNETPNKTISDSAHKTSIQPLSDIMDIHYDSKKKTIIIELEKKGVENFDLVLTESHPLVSTFFDQKKIKMFKVNHKPSGNLNYIWTSTAFEFEVAKPVLPFQQDEAFFLVLDPARQSIIDNWFYCRMKQESLAFWTFQPIHQVNNPEFKNFYIDRIRGAISEHFPFLYLKNYIQSEVSTVASSKVKTGIVLPATLEVPNFSFWNAAHIEKFLQDNLSKVIRRSKKNNEVSI